MDGIRMSTYKKHLKIRRLITEQVERNRAEGKVRGRHRCDPVTRPGSVDAYGLIRRER
jgi:hypothetical protein